MTFGRISSLLKSSLWGPTLEAESQVALKEELARMRECVNHSEPIMIVAELSDEGRIERILHREHDPHVGVFSVDKRLHKGSYRSPDYDGNPVTFSLIRTVSDKWRVGWHNLLSDLRELLTSQNFVFLGDCFGDLDCCEEDLVDVEGMIESSRYHRTAAIFNPFDFNTKN